MLQKLAKLGRLVPADEIEIDPLNLNKKYAEDYVVFFHFSWNATEQKFVFLRVEIEEFRPEEYQKYLFVSVQGTGTSNFPTIDVFNREDLFFEGSVNFTESKTGIRFVRILRKYGTYFDTLIQELLENQQLKQELNQTTKEVKRFLLSLKIDGHYVGGFSVFQQKATELGATPYNKDYYTDKDKIYEKENSVCSLCQQKNKKVWGFVSPYAFYAVKTEKSVVSGGFDRKYAWKNFPVCPEDSLFLDCGQKFLEKYLSFKFCGYPYFLVPEFISTQQMHEQDAKEQLHYLKNFEKYTLADEGKGKILEIDLVNFLSEQKNSANYTLFFYEKNNAEFKILASIDDVFPSHGVKLKDIKEKLEKEILFANYQSETYPSGLKFQFKFLKTFFPDNKIEGSFKSDFLKITRAIFMQKTLSYPHLLQHIMRKIRNDFAKDELHPLTILKSFMILKFLSKAKLIQITKDFDEVTMKNIYEEFFQQHPNFFTTNSRKAIFLEGVLCQRLLNIQFKDRNATPFRSRLNGLKLSKKDIERLLPEIINKLEEYKKNYYKNLEALISTYLLDTNWNLTLDEISFYFVMGMNLAKELKEEKEEETLEAIEK